MPYAEFPWFKDAPIAKLAHVIQPHPVICTGRSSTSTCPSHRSATRQPIPCAPPPLTRRAYCPFVWSNVSPAPVCALAAPLAPGSTTIASTSIKPPLGSAETWYVARAG